MDTITITNYIKRASELKENAYSPYSKFKVGAIIIDKNGQSFEGVNVENSAYGLTICAEGNAITNAIAQVGKLEIDKVILASSGEDFVFPCGACRQIIAEFAHEATKVISSNSKGEYIDLKLENLLPNCFKLIK